MLKRIASDTSTTFSATTKATACSGCGGVAWIAGIAGGIATALHNGGVRLAATIVSRARDRELLAARRVR